MKGVKGLRANTAHTEHHDTPESADWQARNLADRIVALSAERARRSAMNDGSLPGSPENPIPIGHSIEKQKRYAVSDNRTDMLASSLEATLSPADREARNLAERIVSLSARLAGGASDVVPGSPDKPIHIGHTAEQQVQYAVTDTNERRGGVRAGIRHELEGIEKTATRSREEVNNGNKAGDNPETSDPRKEFQTPCEKDQGPDI